MAARPPGRASLKASAAYGQYQQRRRSAALEQQRNARDGKLQLARMLAAERLEAAAQGQPGGSMAVDAPDDGAGRDGARRQRPGTGGASSGGGVDEGGGGSFESGPLDGLGLAPGSGGLSGADLRRHYAAQLMLPEWLTDVPPDLAAKWLAIPRPEGRRCLVVAAHGSTSVRARSGVLLGRFQSALPGGSRGGAGGGPGEFCVLDAVLVEPANLAQGGGAGAAPAGQQQQQQQQQREQQEQQQASGEAQAPEVEMGEQQQQQQQERERGRHNQGQQHAYQGGGGGGGLAPGCVLFASDVLAWRGVLLAGCTAECRAFWLAGKMAECGPPPAGAPAGPALCALPALAATPEGLEAAARGPASGAALGFVQDGCYLLHRDGHYTPGPSPLALVWKDASCSRYLLDTDAEGAVPPTQQLVLTYRADATVATADEPPVVLGRMPPDWVAAMGPKLLRPGRLLRFGLAPGGLRFEGGRPAGADLKYEGPANQRRARADAFSKILFQALARAGEAPALRALCEASAAGAGNMAQDEPGGGGGGDVAAVAGTVEPVEVG